MLVSVPAGLVNYQGGSDGDEKIWLTMRGIRAAIGPDVEEAADIVLSFATRLAPTWGIARLASVARISPPLA